MRNAIAVFTLMIFGVSSTPSFQTRMIEYEVDGTANYANVTWNTGAGGTEQKQIKFPFCTKSFSHAGRNIGVHFGSEGGRQQRNDLRDGRYLTASIERARGGPHQPTGSRRSYSRCALRNRKG